MARQVTKVLVDANILYSRTLRDWVCLLYLRSAGGMFECYWTEDIMAEMLYHRRKANPFLSEQQVGGIRRLIAETFGDHSLITGYEVTESSAYPDVFDAHVHCAAVHGEIDILLTANTSDFDGLDELTYEIYGADDFLQLIDDSNTELVRGVMAQQLAYWVPRGGKSLPEALRSAGAPGFAERIRRYLQTTDVTKILEATAK